MMPETDLRKRLEPSMKLVTPAPLVLTEEEKREREADLKRIAGSPDDRHPVLVSVDALRPVSVVERLEHDDRPVVSWPETLRKHRVLEHRVPALLHICDLKQKTNIQLIQHY
jgi:hypothetical protein